MFNCDFGCYRLRRTDPFALRGMLVAFLLLATVPSHLVCAAEALSSREEATAQLAVAERAVAEAAARGALWTTAREALERARQALAAGDFASALRHSTTAAEQARLGIAQLAYPPLRF